ncbi:MAG: hypothetical protein HQM09_20670 [Candidatus Riflebacteria bacterium]|nr:hypothetical protein [Candidatus Riflebacteria bacterium]
MPQPMTKPTFRLSDIDLNSIRGYFSDLTNVSSAIYDKFPGVTNDIRVLRILVQMRIQEIARLSNIVSTDEAMRPKITDMDPLVTFMLSYVAISIISYYHPMLQTWAIWNARNLRELKALDVNFESHPLCWPLMKDSFKGVAHPPRRMTFDLQNAMLRTVPLHLHANSLECFARRRRVGTPEPIYPIALRRWERGDQFDYFNGDVNYMCSTGAEFRAEHLRTLDVAAISSDWDAIKEFLGLMK